MNLMIMRGADILTTLYKNYTIYSEILLKVLDL